MAVFLKNPAETNPEWGKRPEERSMQEHLKFGFINLDKPPGPTSHQIINFVKDILKIDKAGHSGSLDPKVTGILPVGINEGTKVLQSLLKFGKEYVCLMHLHKKVPETRIRKTFSEFIGVIDQLPPVKSAVKREWRKREIYNLKILEIEGQDVLFIIECEAGTYVRKFCHDFGKKIGAGAHMQELRRIRVGPFNEEYHLITLQKLNDAYHYYKKEGNEKYLRYCVLPVEFAVSHLPKVWVLDSAVNSICYGAKLNNPGIAQLSDNIKEKDLIAIMTLKDELIALGTALADSISIKKQRKGTAAKLVRVVMPQDTYPKIWTKKIK